LFKKLKTEELNHSKKINQLKIQGEQAVSQASRQASIEALGLFKQTSIAYKAIAITLTIIDTVRGITRALADYIFPYSLIVAALVGVAGTVQTAKIAGLQFALGGLVPGYAGGGLSGTRIQSHHGRPINRSNGDNRLATVRVGEVILNEQQQARLGGASTFSRIGVPGFASGGQTGLPSLTAMNTARNSESNFMTRDFLDAVSRIQPVVTVEDINTSQRRVEVTESRARVFR
jgi:hypothetical protein